MTCECCAQINMSNGKIQKDKSGKIQKDKSGKIERKNEKGKSRDKWEMEKTNRTLKLTPLLPFF